VGDMWKGKHKGSQHHLKLLITVFETERAVFTMQMGVYVYLACSVLHM
jgi:hypothetical protein